MAHMGCSCGNNIWDGDGHIVYDVFSKKDLVEYIQNGKMNNRFEEIYDDYPPFYEDNTYFWLCDECKTVHMWSYTPEYYYRIYKLTKNLEEISIDDIKELDEYFVINLYDYDIIDEMLIKDFIEKNPIRPYKYYITRDLTKVYIINTDVNKLDRIYELTYESFVEYDCESESFDNILIYTIDKMNSGHEYVVENGIRKQKDTNDYPHKQVNFMITEKGNNGGSVSYADPNLEPETYTINTMDEFNKKYGKYYSEKKNIKLMYIYVEYLDMLGDRLYCYRSEEDYKIGDIVVVPRGWNDEDVEARVVNIAYYSEKDAPYPYNELKEIVGYAEENNDGRID